MNVMEKLANERFARRAAKYLKFVCYFVIAFYALGLLLSLMGRQTFYLHTSMGSFERAIYAEEDHDPPSRGLTINIGDDVHVWTGAKDRIDPEIRFGLAMMYAVHTVPLAAATWFLSRVFSGIQQGEIFTQQNAVYLLFHGLLQCFAAVFAPLLKLLICRVVSLICTSRMSVSTGHTMFQTLFPGIAFIVAAYIIHTGVHLQDEVDHTL